MGPTSGKQRVRKDCICVAVHFNLLIDVVAVRPAFVSALLRVTLGAGKMTTRAIGLQAVTGILV